MCSHRSDGRVVKNIEPFQKIVPYLMKTRTDSMNMFDEQIDCAPIDAYIAKKKEEGIQLSYLEIVIAAVVRTIAQRPQLNRFVMRGRVYTRNSIWVCFVVHTTLRSEDAGTTIKLRFDGTESIIDIAAKIDEAIKKETDKAKEHNGTDKLAATIMGLPPFLIRPAVNLILWLDRHNMCPKAIIDASPFHTSFFITNMKSLGINPIFHHVYEFGTTGLFVAIGKEKYVSSAISKTELGIRKEMGMNVVTDERFCDGLYFARSFRIMRNYLRFPENMEERLAAKVEDCE